MKPSQRKFDYEMVSTDDWVLGTLKDIERDEEHKTTFKGQEEIKDCIRFVFALDGYKYIHKSRWMTFVYSEKSNLYNKYLISLVDGIAPFCDFDVELLEGMRVKMMWKTEKGKDGNNYQRIELIRPVGEKIKITSSAPANDNVISLDDVNLSAEEDGSEVPF